MLDRNKSRLTHDVTRAVASWMDGRGMKPVETEVYIQGGWCADLAASFAPTQTELIEMRLIARKPPWKAPKEKQDAWEASCYALLRLMVVVVEVKTSRADYSKDKKWKITNPVDLCYVAIPSGMVREEEYPEGWGVLAYLSDGSIRCVRNPTPAVSTIERRMNVIYQIAIRRDHHTRHKRMREYNQKQRMDDCESKSIERIGSIARVLISIARGENESVEGCLKRLRYDIPKMPAYVMETLQELWGVAK